MCEYPPKQYGVSDGITTAKVRLRVIMASAEAVTVKLSLVVCSLPGDTQQAFDIVHRTSQPLQHASL